MHTVTAKRRRSIAVVVVATTLLSACWGGGDDAEPAPETTSTTPVVGPVDTEPVVTVEGITLDAEAAPVLGVRLSEGQAAEVATTIAQVEGTALSQAEIDAVIDRLPTWDVTPADQVGFNRPAATLLPPLVGDTIETVFPPTGESAGPDEGDYGPLEVVRYQPEGDVTVAPFLTVTFNQPMVPLATLEQLDAADVPAVITPSIEGRWRWIGTRTLRFELVPGVIDRLPAATAYTVEIPAGTTSASGNRLAESVTWSFATPPPTVVSTTGLTDSSPLEPVIVIAFDQRVDAAAVLETTTLTADGDGWPIRLATADEIDADESARQTYDSLLEQRGVAVVPARALPTDAAIQLVVEQGTASAEGPLTSTETHRTTGRTFGNLSIAASDCGYGAGCEPGSPFNIKFTNNLDPAAFDASFVTVDPEIPGLRIDVYGNTIQLSGATSGQTTYDVTLSGALSDVFGQTLGDDQTVSFDVGSAPPSFQGIEQEWVTTDPLAETPTVSVTTINHDSIHVTAYAVTPANLKEFRDFQQRQYSDEAAAAPEWPVVLDEDIEIDARTDEFVETAVDLSSAFNQSNSQLVVVIKPTREFSSNDDLYWRNRPSVTWVQKTSLAIDAFLDNDHLLIWTTDLATGKPVSGVPVELIGDGRVATTDQEGVADLELSDVPVLGLWANAGDTRSFLPSAWWEGWTQQAVQDEGRWYVFDDRGIYRPGETARLTGWIRNFRWSDDRQLALFSEGSSITYTAYDPQGNELASDTLALNALGGFHLMIDIPAGANLGQAWVEFALAGGQPGEVANFGHAFQIQEFRTPEFEVTARTESSGPYYVAQPATVAVDAEYYSGGPLPEADVNWLVSTTETSYSPPNWSDYTFGIWTPWWQHDIGFGGPGIERASASDGDICFDCGPYPGFGTEYEEFSGVTDGDGHHFLQIDFDGPDVDLPRSVTAEATVFDVNRQAFADRVDLLVHPAQYYVGLKSDRAFVEAGTPIRIDAVITDVDGATVAGRDFTVTAARVEWGYTDGQWGEQLVDEQTCALTSTDDATDASMRCEFTAEVGGTYRVTSVVVDDTGHRNRTERTQWVSGGTSRPNRGVQQEAITMVPDRETYAPGDEAEILVQAPFAPAYGLLTVVRGGVISTETFEAEDGSAVLRVPIEDEYVPNLTIQVDMVGASERFADDGTPLLDIPERPAFAVGQIDLSIPPVSRTLDVTATPAAAEVDPGDETSVLVTVLGPDGEPVSGADVAVVVVDEAVLGLTGYELPDPLAAFYANVWSSVQPQYTRSSVLLDRAELFSYGSDGDTVEGDSTDAGGALDAPTAAPAEEAAADDSANRSSYQSADAAPIELRSNFDALAVYAPDATTASDGTVTVALPLPDNLTRYRIMAVAVDGVDHFGTGESTITARLPLQIRPSAPRFLNYGDRFELPVVVQNQTDAPIEVDVAVQISNLDAAAPLGQRVTVPGNNRVEVRFPLDTDAVGTARFRVAATSGDFTDAAEISLPVYTPATAEAFATYGVIDEGPIAQPVLAPTNVFPQFGGLEIGTSSTALQALTDAVIYLADYRYDSTDGFASRIMAIAALRDVLEAFDAAELPSPEELNVQVNRDVTKLSALQNDDGGFPYWQRGRESIPYVSIQAVHALVLADQAGYTVPSDTLNRALDHIADIESHFPTEYSEQIRNSLSAYALYVRNLAGQRDVSKATALYERARDTLEPDAIAWLWPSIDDEDLRFDIELRVLNSAVDTAGAVTFATNYTEDAYVIAQSERRTDGILLDALITEAPASDLIPKTVAGLLGGQTKGRWNNVQENAFILLALNRYFDTFESVTPDFIARAWLGEIYAAEVPFAGRTTDRATTLVPMADLVAAGDSTVTLAKDGQGRLYYRLGLRYAPSDLQLPARDEGFVVDRTYEAVDNPDDVTRDPDGTWHIAAGTSVRVRLTMVADARRTHVALIDPLPAGLEPINPALAVSTTIPPEDAGDTDATFPSYWGWNWFDHQNLRDDRAEAFSSILYGGTYEYSYVARATTPGEFVVPPARAEEVYSPEVFGRSASDTVVID